MSTLTPLFQAALRQWIADDVRVDTVVTLPDVAQDHSGAIVRFYRIGYTTRRRSAEIDLVTKDALLYERHILALLNAQAHATIPFSFALDMHTPTASLLCQQHAGTRRPLSQHHLTTVAQALAAIHSVNRGAPYLPWMRRLTSQTFFPWWRHAWEQACGNADFVREFHAYLAPIERAAQRFAHVLDGLWQDGRSATVLHTDLSAWHVLIRDDHPYLIDWEQTRYGPYYLDLVNLFTLRTVPLYYEALAQLDSALSFPTFITHFHAVWAFGGLKYMVPALLDWVAGERQDSRMHLQALLPRAVATHAPSE